MIHYDSVIDLVDSLIARAYRAGASDIHLEPQQGILRVRLRVDGLLAEAGSLPAAVQAEVISRIKILSGLRTDQQRVPQDGRFQAVPGRGNPVDVRVSVVPTHYGESAVLRLLTKRDGESGLSLAGLGFTPTNQSLIHKALSRTQGLILVTGPTGSGKTTTLYTFLQMLNQPEACIITIEDPVEYAMAGVRQIQTNPHHGLNFSNGLRSILRQDPDIIMVGEIRDEETARLAVNAALTGHLLLATMHTNSAAAALPRLLDLGIEPYLVAATVRLVASQRLVRKTSTNGFSGRTGIHEVLAMDDILRSAVARRTPLHRLQKLAVLGGMQALLEDGRAKAEQGLTTVEEVLRVAQTD
jgi:type II secretory ATPase GspE/PulE/Tfp pilus assembly ATPase PilB-like protein